METYLVFAITILTTGAVWLSLPTINTCEKCQKGIRYGHKSVNGFGGNTYHASCFYTKRAVTA